MSSKSAWDAAFGANYVIPSTVPLDDGGDGLDDSLWWVNWNGKQVF